MELKNEIISIKEQLSAVEARKTDFKDYPEQWAWMGGYLWIQNQKITYIEKLLSLTESLDKLICELKKLKKIPSDIITPLEETNTILNGIASTIFLDSDKKYISSLTQPLFNGYIPDYVIQIIEKIRLLITSPKFKPNSEGKSLLHESLNGIEADLGNIISEFNKLTPMEIETHQTTPMHALQELKTHANTLQMNTKMCNVQYFGLFRILQGQLRQAIVESREMIRTPKNEKINSLKEDFRKNLQQKLGLFTYENSTLEALTSLWDKSNQHCAKVINISNELQKRIEFLENYARNDDYSSLNVIKYCQAISFIRAIKHFFDLLNYDLSHPIPMIYNKLEKDILASDRCENSINQQIKSTENKIENLFKDKNEKINFDDIFDISKDMITQLLGHIADYMDVDNLVEAKTKRNQIATEYKEIKIKFEVARQFSPFTKDLFC